ncbi:MAG TPA: cob(I)yrinic acid a,c-diamide adenosyltransferase [Candidatus Omnitrophota bacterium]|nr:cob(I)yrinic acid a,c-diamide adenosyltransferase [Candidatus Omnitrophota bacterium]HPD85369.1 cob(I)yrinic acid a,c-diamide adenosyltransferase [Candidatus Omnitrophota bacterium]HRZ04130.1 cob(I)yrinic acid a,c-diamide adenosyltransferase [Candidatus Omnitrophota bacterium]
MDKKSITTKQGDKGQTRIFSGEWVSKNSPRPKICGQIDELTCILGIARFHVRKNGIRKEIIFIQHALVTAAAELATSQKSLGKLSKRIDAATLKIIDDKCRELECKVKTPAGMIIPAGSLAASYIDYARAVTRRCEIKIVKLFENKIMDNKILIAWFNRLSDYLYLLARHEEGKPILAKKS